MAIELRVRRHPLTSVNFFYARALYGISANFLTLTFSSILIFITSKAGLPPFLLLFYTIIIFFNEIRAFLTYHQERPLASSLAPPLASAHFIFQKLIGFVLTLQLFILCPQLKGEKK